MKFLQIFYGYLLGVKIQSAKYFKIIRPELQTFENINLLSFVYPSRFVNVKSKYRKEVNHERFTGLKNLAGLSPYPFEKNTVRAYEFTLAKFNQNFAELNLSEVSTDDILDFMTKFTEGRKPQTKRIRFAHLTAFFNFLKNKFDSDLQNPCDSPMLRKLFRPKAVKNKS